MSSQHLASLHRPQLVSPGPGRTQRNQTRPTLAARGILMTSEVQRLLQQIEAEYIAGQRALHAFQDTARHDFITTRMENMGQLHEQLDNLVGGPIPAMAMIATRIKAIIE